MEQQLNDQASIIALLRLQLASAQEREARLLGAHRASSGGSSLSHSLTHSVTDSLSTPVASERLPGATAAGTSVRGLGVRGQSSSCSTVAAASHKGTPGSLHLRSEGRSHTNTRTPILGEDAGVRGSGVAGGIRVAGDSVCVCVWFPCLCGMWVCGCVGVSGFRERE